MHGKPGTLKNTLVAPQQIIIATVILFQIWLLTALAACEGKVTVESWSKICR